MQSISKEEQNIIALVREKDFQKIIIQVTNGRIDYIRREETIKPQANAKK